MRERLGRVGRCRRAAMEVGALLVALLSAGTPLIPSARAEGHPRDGFTAGVNVGVGSAAYGQDLTNGRREGIAFNARVGYATADDAVVGIEAVFWSSDDSDEASASTSIIAFAYTLYPGGGGFWLRGGLGWGRIRLSGPIPDEPEPVDFDEGGWGLVGAAGYEFRLGSIFALGLEFDIGYADAGSFEQGSGPSATSTSVSANWYSLTVAFNGYW